MEKQQGGHNTGRTVHSILYAEDDPDIREALAEALSTAGYLVEAVSDGRQALVSAVSNISHYDLLITDHQMPRMDGLTLVANLRQADFPGWILVLAGSIGQEARQRYSQFHVDGIIRKPFRLDELVVAVEALFRQPRRSYHERQKLHFPIQP